MFFIFSTNLKINEISKILYLPFAIIKKIVNFFKKNTATNITADVSNINTDVKDSLENTWKEKQPI